MGELSTFCVSVLAGVVAHYICKWLDRRFANDEPRR